MQKKKILLIGWDAADWKAINPMMDAGLMPNLEKLVNEGVMGNLATLDPPLSPMLWTSIGTGKRPYKHGIWGFSEPRPDGKGIRPVLNTSRKCKAIWNMLTQENYKTHVIGWWPSHPAEPINGTMVSNFYQKAHYPKENEQLTEWPMMQGTVHPASKSDLFAKMRVHPQELTANHLLPFLPNAPNMKQDDKRTQKRIHSVAKIIADCSTIHSAATYIMEYEEWDFLGVYYDAIDHFGHGFMKFHPPKQDHIPQDLYDDYHYVITAGYRYHDMMLGRLMELAGEDTTIMLISDHGFHPDHLRPKAIPKEPAGPALEHSPYGIVVIKGPNIKKDERIYGASLLDITPTVLAMLDLPVGEDMDGKVLSDAFIKPPELKSVDSWENIEGECGMHDKDVLHDPYMDAEALEQLVELGYIDKPDENAEKAIKKTVDENHFWLARSYMNGQMYEEALSILERLFNERPDQTRYGFRLMRCYEYLNRIDDAQQTLQVLKGHIPQEGAGLHLMEGNLHLLQNNADLALEQLLKAEVKAPDNPNIHLLLGQAYLKLNRYIDAERAFLKALNIDPQSHRAHYGLGLSYLRRGLYEEAAQSLVEAIALIYYFPLAHYNLGEALYQLGDFEGAAHAYEVSLSMNENISKARQKLAVTYEHQLDQPEKAAVVSEELVARTLKEIVVVSGLPRSGTSMMMQMLDKGGIAPFTDKKREADESNPKGYYEHDAVKGLSSDKKFLKDIEENQVVKIIAQLLFQLPLRYRYKVIFMERDLDEVVQSQQHMLDRLAEKSDKKMPPRRPNRMKRAFQQALTRVGNWQQQMPNVEVCFIPYTEAIANPMEVAKKVNEFLGGELDVRAMASVVDKSLYREKIEE
ncbi:MAG: alkaline phosphatase family protein [Chitinophagales bacterium]